MSVRKELTALRSVCFGPNQEHFPEVADIHLEILAHVLAQQTEGVWRAGGEFQTLLAAHSLRQLTQLGVSLRDRWNISSEPESREGNLVRIVRLLIDQRHAPSPGRWSMWADDPWDDCYVGLALQAAQPELTTVDSSLAAKADDLVKETYEWIQSQASEGFTKSTAGQWKGPALGAAVIEFATVVPGAHAAEMIASAVSIINTNLGAAANAAWRQIGPWHVGQVIAAWHRHRARWPAVDGISALVGPLYAQLLSGQQEGAWVGPAGPNSAEALYCTARALTAVYLMEQGKPTPATRAAHDFIIREARRDPPLHGPKACLNVLEALQHLLEFNFKDLSGVQVHLLLTLAARLKRCGLEQFLDSDGQSDDAFTAAMQTSARRAVEASGQSCIQPIGINDTLNECLLKQPVFFKEFAADPNRTRSNLRRFLSATIDEVRSHTARELLQQLWSKDGFLTFLPILERVSDLEHRRAFYSRYRDHVNHELMFFLTGCVFFYQCDQVRAEVNAEITKYNEEAATAPQDPETEFLFRWKLIATFHDIGYMFEVDPDTGEVPHLNKKTLIDESLKSLSDFGAEFPQHYLQRRLGLAKADAVALAAELDKVAPAKPPKPYAREDDLFGPAGEAWTRIGAYTGERVPAVLLNSYFEMCRKEKSSREPFLDHGLMSALVFLATTEVQHDAVLAWQQAALQRQLKAKQFDRLRAILSDETAQQHLVPGRFWVRFNHVAGAMGLHNIYPGLHSETVCKKYGLDQAFYGADPARRYKIVRQETPLAFLTSLVDALQDWDRHTFRRPTFGGDTQHPIASGDVWLGTTKGGPLRLRALSPTARTRYRKQFEIMPNWMSGIEDCITLED